LRSSPRSSSARAVSRYAVAVAGCGDGRSVT
jgi:hypothetical protein